MEIRRTCVQNNSPQMIPILWNPPLSKTMGSGGAFSMNGEWDYLKEPCCDAEKRSWFWVQLLQRSQLWSFAKLDGFVSSKYAMICHLWEPDASLGSCWTLNVPIFGTLFTWSIYYVSICTYDRPNLASYLFAIMTNLRWTGCPRPKHQIPSWSTQSWTSDVLNCVYHLFLGRVCHINGWNASHGKSTDPLMLFWLKYFPRLTRSALTLQTHSQDLRLCRRMWATGHRPRSIV